MRLSTLQFDICYHYVSRTGYCLFLLVLCVWKDLKAGAIVEVKLLHGPIKKEIEVVFDYWGSLLYLKSSIHLLTPLLFLVFWKVTIAVVYCIPLAKKSIWITKLKQSKTNTMK